MKIIPASIKILSLFLILNIYGICHAASPKLFYSDLLSGPKTGGQNNKGVFVTVWGKDFGSTRGSSYVTIGGGQADNYPEWSDTKICFQLGSNAQTGLIKVVTGEGVNSTVSMPEGDFEGLPFTVRTTGNIYFVDINATSEGNGSYSSPWRNPHNWYTTMDAGDTCYFRGGTYSGAKYGNQSFTSGQWILHPRECNQGTEENPIAFVGYPGENAYFFANSGSAPYSVFINHYSGAFPDWVVVAKFKMKAHTKCFGGGMGNGVRFIGNDCDGLNRTDQAQVGTVGFGQHAKILGNKIHGGRTRNKFDHAIYNGGCPYNGDIEIGYNHVYDNDFGTGALIALNHEGSRCGEGEYVKDAYIHHNIFDMTLRNTTALGIFDLSYEYTDPESEMPHTYVYNNIVIGGDANADSPAPMYAYNGKAYFYNNTFYNAVDSKSESGVIYFRHAVINSSTKMLYHGEARNNIIHKKPSASNYIRVSGGFPDPHVPDATMILSNNVYYGDGTFTNTNGWTDSDPINADPKFRAPLSGDFSLMEDSPARNAGSSLAGTIVKTDFNGTVRSLFDAGAYAFDETSAGSPYTSDHDPIKGARGFFKQQVISLHIKDDQEGVVVSSITMKVNGITVEPTIASINGSNEYKVSYTPTSELPLGDIVVQISAEDSHVPPYHINEQYVIRNNELRKME